ncbi:MAG: ribonuclease P protein component [Gammaproteobacteria bacterium]|nr:ribonuclease P protein component [Gammaproteobacteria bacterium]
MTASNPSQALLRRTAGFPRLKRLTKAKDFGRVFANPTRSSDRYFTALSHPNKGNTARLGLTVSRRIARNAVDRNRLKRLAREVFRCQQDLPLLDFVVLANKAAPAAENRVLRDSLQRHFDILAARMD